jgi:hypothetical protein
VWVAGAYIISAGALMTGQVHIETNGDLSMLNSPAGSAASWG